MDLAKIKFSNMKFRRVNFQLLKKLLVKIPWETVLRDRGTDQSWQHFKDTFLRVQELCIPMCKSSSRKSTWLSTDLLVKLRCKKEMHRQWKQGHVAWVEYRDAIWMCRDRIRKAKAQVELSLARDAKNNKKGIYRYICQKRKAKESVSPL